VAVEIVLRLSAVCRDGQLLDRRGSETPEHTNLQATAGTLGGERIYIEWQAPRYGLQSSVQKVRGRPGQKKIMT
jgi:hypothetical protein